MKRRAQDWEEQDDQETPKRSRRIALDNIHLSDGVFSIADNADDADYTRDSCSSDHDEDDDRDNASSTNTAPTSATLKSGASPARRKFPSELKTIRCTWPGCDKAFNRPARLTAHLRSHTNDRPFKCPHAGCDKSYLEDKHLKQHISASHSTERSHTCEEPGCGKSFLTSTRLRRHQLVHEGQERFRCREFPPCTQSFRKHQTLQRHIRSEHLHESAFQCAFEGCTAGFDTANTLKRHVDREHSENKFWCDECTKDNKEDGEPNRVGFPTLDLLQMHMKRAHIRCTFCDRIFPGRDAMNEHVELEHSMASLERRKKILCPWQGCDKTFVKQANLKAHYQTIHEGMRFVCGEFDIRTTEDLADWPISDGCGDAFVTKSNLEKHIRHIHLGIPRPAPPVTTKSAPKDTLGQLTNTSDRARRTIPCSWAECRLRFAHMAEMHTHLQTHFDEALLPNMEEDSVMIGNTDPNLLDIGNLSPFASQPLNTELNEEWGYAAPDDIGNHECFQTPDVDWQRDEAEMRQLIGSHELGELLDPALR